ncbi:histidinol-phosphate aminotransferase [Streptosporangium becharense]|uniref:Histidinol-phosphate aminotransferase n=1 Tax=Streptosporangium becharense TaxID=1816182 RepID=A0A7W9IMB7_9ACTN|nr:histidinol-phosphate transaminase [Streptosporangium becharense]MBB2910488.1 histidinol-phosphate aminotransferase [Streptosporangium becharense]MBB5823231.1 histidinol-phosphate aminotransferase [Streptosporangium becharense]
MTVKHRAAIDELVSYTPGRTPTGGRPQVKLSSNEMPYGPLPHVVRALAEAGTTLNRYPDFHRIELTAALARRHDVDPAQVVVDNGSGALLQVLASVIAGPGDEILYAWRAFESYPIVTTVAGAASVRVPLDDGYAHDLPAMADAVTDRTRMVIVCNPNNPTGTVVSAADLEHLLDAVPDDVLVVLDEAYHDFVTDPRSADGLDLVRRRPNIAVLRTFSKAYGLAGLRVGYCVTRPETAALIRKSIVGFSVSTLAQAGALASLTPEAGVELKERVAHVIAERTRVADHLTALGVRIVPSQANFIFMPMPDGPARAAAFEERGVILRAYGTDGLRMTVGTAEENDLFLRIAADVLPRG